MYLEGARLAGLVSAHTYREKDTFLYFYQKERGDKNAAQSFQELESVPRIISF